MVRALLLRVSAPWDTTKQGCVLSVPEVPPPQVRVMPCEPKLTVVPPMIVACVPGVLDPLALKVVLPLTV